MTIERTRVRILFDGYWWTNGPISNRTVQREFIVAWKQRFPKDELIIALRNGSETIAPALPQGISTVRVRMWPQGLSNAVELAFLARRYRVDAILAHNFAPLFGPNVCFIHDVMFQEHAEWFSRLERIYFALIPALSRRASVITTSSRTEADRIHRLNPHAGHVYAVGLAVGSSLAHAVPLRPAAVDGLDAFALSVGRINARKNLSAVIEGAARSETVTSTRPLLLVGNREHSGVDARLNLLAREAISDGTARFIGSVSDAELAWLFTHTALVINLSLDEGFGLPPLEAAYFDAPLLVSDIPVFRETVGAVAHFVEPTAPVSVLGAAIDSAWAERGSPEDYRALRTTYSWERAAEALRDAMSGMHGHFQDEWVY